jgi:restriction system protein
MSDEEPSSDKELLADAERLLRDARAFETFGSSRSEALSEVALLERLIEQVSEQQSMSSLRINAYFSLSFVEFARFDLLLLQLWKDRILFIQREDGREVDESVLDDESASMYLTTKGERWLHIMRAVRALDSEMNLVIPVGFVEPVVRLDEGALVEAVYPAWLFLLSRLRSEPDLLHGLHWRIVEEIVAAAYDREGWEVILTPRSGDLGRDIIATRRDIGAIRIFDQIKAFSADRRVSADDVRALNGILRGNVSKGVITTTSDFAPGVRKEFADLIPNRLELRNGQDLLAWLQKLSSDLLK